MFDLEKVKDWRQIKSLLWLNLEEFYFLTDLFWEITNVVEKEEYEERKKKSKDARISSWWNPSELNNSKKKLFFLLYYLKTYPTFDVLWFNFWIDRSTACLKVHKLLPTLRRLLIDLWIAPKREIHNLEELKEAFDWNVLDLILDWTERKYFRHKDNKKQEENYSWKKNVIQRRIQ